MQTSDITPIDLSIYLRSPVFSVQEGISLARALLAAAPKGLPALVRRTADKLRQAADAAQDALLARQREQNQLSEEDSRALDQEMDSVWGGLRLRLQGYAFLSADSVPQAGRAAALLTQLFGSEGTNFLKESYSTQLATMTTLYKRITKDKLGKEIDALCGPEFLAEIRRLLPRYERMVNAMLSRPAASGPSLFVHRSALSRAVVAYATAMCALVDEDAPETLERTVTALAPILGQRNAIAGRRPTGGEDPELPPDSPSAPAPAAG